MVGIPSVVLRCLLLFGLLGCTPQKGASGTPDAAMDAAQCNLDPCEAAGSAQQTHSFDLGVTHGITGVIAYSTDSCLNGCCECSYVATQLAIYEVSAPVTSIAQFRAQLGGTPPLLTLDVDERYAQSLDVARYVVCIPSFERCANIEITPSSVVTLNVRRYFGGSRIVVFDADGNERPDLVVE